MRDVTREQLVAYVERSLELHPELRDILPSGGDGLEPPSPPARDDAPPWCHCGRCREMPRPEEQLCCRRRDGPCILQTAQRDINAVVLGRNVLLVAIRHMNDLFAYDEQPGNDSYRHAAYRQYVLWRFNRLGSGNRVVIPSCVVWSIRDTYPSINGTYTGFKVARLA